MTFISEGFKKLVRITHLISDDRNNCIIHNDLLPAVRSICAISIANQSVARFLRTINYLANCNSHHDELKPPETLKRAEEPNRTGNVK